jgi:hypothetical protein
VTPAAAKRQAAAAPDQPPVEDRGSAAYRAQLELVARLSVLVLRPLDHLDDTHCNIPPLDCPSVRAMARHDAFRAPLNGAVAEATGLAALKFDDGIVPRLLSSSQSRLAALITTAPMQEVQLLANVVAASALWRRLSQFILKADREHAREILGAEGFRIATREAPMLNPTLGELGTSAASASIFRRDADSASCRQALAAFGIDIVRRFLEAVEPLFSDMFTLRLPADAGSGESKPMAPLNDGYCAQVVRLVRRRNTAWSHIIG